MLERIWRGFKNDSSLYSEIKGESTVQVEALVVVLGLALLTGVIAFVAETFTQDSEMQPSISAIITATAFVLGYIVVTIWAWLIGSLIGPGKGSMNDIRVGLAYGIVPLALYAIPTIGGFLALWALVTQSSAIRETLEIGKGLTFFIVLTSLFIQLSLLIGGFLILIALVAF